MLPSPRATPLAATAGNATDTGSKIPVFARRFGSWHLSLQRQPFDAADLATSYDRAAAGWHRTIDRLDCLPAYQDLLRQALDRWPETAATHQLRVLDCGTGTGAMSEALAREYTDPLRLDAVDISAAMLNKAGDRLKAIGLDVALRQADAQQLPYADNSFDMVMAGHMLEHLPQPVAALREMARVVRPGGLVFVCITPRTLAGLWIHLLWRTHMVTPAEARSWLRHADLQEVRCISPNSNRLFGRLSLACCGIKRGNQI